MSVGVQQELVIMLAVQVNQLLSCLFEEGGCAGCVVDEAA